MSIEGQLIEKNGKIIDLNDFFIRFFKRENRHGKITNLTIFSIFLIEELMAVA
jgi:hypothetical protein